MAPPPAAHDELTALRARVAQLEAELQAAAEREARARLQIAALRGAENSFATVFAHAPFGIVVGTLDDSLLQVNAAFTQIIGYSAAEIMALTWPAITHPDDYARELPLIGELLAGSREHYQIEKRYFHKDGRTVPVRVTGLVVRSAAGAPQACVALVEDLTARVQAEETRGYLATILETTPDPVAYLTLDGRVQYLNRAWRRACAIPDDADLDAVDLGGCQPAWARRLTAEVGIPAAARDGIWQGETIISGASGAATPVRQTILALHDRAGQLSRLAIVLHAVEDERRAARERMAIERTMLEAQRLESLGVMAAGIAHDFNNILTAILGNADLALLSPNLDRPTRHSLEAVLDGAQRAAELTRQILTYAGKGQVAPQPLDLNRTISALANLLRGSAGRRSRLLLALHDPLPLVETDGGQLRQVLLNLVINAGEAIEAIRPDGTISIGTALERLTRADLDSLIYGDALQPGPYVRLSVEDDGCGMDETTAARMFDPFFSTKFLGRGLGLAAVQGIVRVHRGAMLVESTPHKGTRFSIWLPAWAEADSAPRPRDGHARRRGAALIVEGEREAGTALAAGLRQLGFAPIVAPTATAALAELAAGIPELALALVADDAWHLGSEHVAQAVAAIAPGTPVLRLGPGGDLQHPVSIEALRLAVGVGRRAGARGRGL